MQNDATYTEYVGTCSYMAPERLNGQNVDKGYRIQSDVWSLGLSVYSLSTGSLPFLEKSDLNDLQRYFEEHEQLEIPDDGTFTPEQREFLVACLKYNEHERPDYETLLQMNFLTDVKIKNYREVFAKFVRKILIL